MFAEDLREFIDIILLIFHVLEISYTIISIILNVNALNNV